MTKVTTTGQTWIREMVGGHTYKLGEYDQSQNRSSHNLETGLLCNQSTRRDALLGAPGKALPFPSLPTFPIRLSYPDTPLPVSFLRPLFSVRFRTPSSWPTDGYVPGSQSGPRA